jgi:flavin reductase (DIM6/NTAB) family NADH-FMN oxidoreductase RutF
MILDPTHLSHAERYKILTGTIVPRPIAWVSSLNEAGQANLAPFSYFTIASINPLTLLFCPQIPPEANTPKDTLLNIQARGEFVINLTDEATAEAMNLTATALPRSQSEFAWAGVTPVGCQTVQVPRVAEAPVAFECHLDRIITLNNKPGGGAVVFGVVQKIHLRDDIFEPDRAYIKLETLRPIGRLAGSEYAYIREKFALQRVPAPKTPPSNT